VADATEGGRPFAELRGAKGVVATNGRVTFTLPSGSYKFATPAPK
jgi:hypothetical protein